MKDHLGSPMSMTQLKCLVMNASVGSKMFSLMRYNIKLSRRSFFDEKCIPFTNNTSYHRTTHDIITSLKGNY